MAEGLKQYSTVPANNNQQPPAGAPEGMSPAAVNDTMRELMANARISYEDSAFVDLGHTPVFVNSTRFTIAGDVTNLYTQNRRIRLISTVVGNAYTSYATISSSTFSSPNTTVNITVDSGDTFNSNVSLVAFGVVDENAMIEVVGNFVPTTRTVTAGTGLNGGGDLSANRTFNLANTSVTPGSYTLASLSVDQQGRLTAASSGSSGFQNMLNEYNNTVELTANDTTIIASRGVTSFTRSGSNFYTLTFSSAFANTNYQIFIYAAMYSGAHNSLWASNITKSTSSISFSVENQNGTVSIPDNINITVKQIGS